MFDNGTFVINKWNSVSDVTDGTSQTYGVGESVHPAKWGLGDGYGNPNVGGPVSWWHGAACPPSRGECDVNSTSYGRCLRRINNPLNASIMPMADDDSNDAPFGSDHPGGAQFCFVDGHVEFVSESIDFGVYQAGSTRSGNEVIDPAASFRRLIELGVRAVWSRRRPRGWVVPAYNAPHRIWLAAVTALLAGCGGNTGIVPVTGQITWEGAAVTAGRITFYPDTGRPATAAIQSDGSYELTTLDEGDGVQVGPHVVTILRAARSAARPRRSHSKKNSS